MIRVVLTGSESTGKTTLAQRLAKHYKAEFVPEFVREFAERKGGAIDFNDHGAIARGQMALEDEHIARGNRLVVQDTDLLSTVVYCDHYFGRCPAWIVEMAAARKPDLYLLCDIDVAWVADGVRDRGERREEMQALFLAAVGKSGVPFISLAGDIEARMGVAIGAIDALLASEQRQNSVHAD
jgi:NadR type nicotinamide-nucleotide adenylyltransferase